MKFKLYAYALAVVVLAGLYASMAPASHANGISLSNSRVIFPAEAKQTSMSLKNTQSDVSMLVQSWIEDAAGRKTSDFVVTPPLYLSRPGDENLVRILATGGDHAKDRETLYRLVVKSVASRDRREVEHMSGIAIALTTSVKLFVRPSGLEMARQDAEKSLAFARRGNRLAITNASPYFLTLVDIQAGSRGLENVMLEPFGRAELAMPSDAGNQITYKSISDHGGLVSGSARVSS